jgi:hypothetical protein
MIALREVKRFRRAEPPAALRRGERDRLPGGTAVGVA